HNWEGELATGEEAGFLAVDGDQVGLGKDLQKIFTLQRLNDRSEVNIGTEQEQVQNVVDVLIDREWVDLTNRRADLLRAKSAELAGGGSSDCVGDSGGKQVCP